MATWKDVEDAEPEFAARVRKIFDAGENKIIATLRADGSPRVSGIEAQFRDGEVTFGSMPGSRKGADLRRDPRFALHAPSPDPPQDKTTWAGDAKLSGRAVPVGALTEGPEGEHFRAEIDEVVVTRLNDSATMLVIESWRPGGGLRRVERA
ncbi:pyridoxamine 5'-phosphate oxidase family protein [Pseudonocardia humida]|uniref:Pyridoxamine 5'-phosphate oxidase family protein n=1 Tax=Pseudonocardia humida TaxID=2800819 RepID=A0ABT1AAG4_9PSEU|nr:pyridoxamine 5'-phosphate oxidase family protein [Pseudonocardia humida]MCO1660025.1 pyridoxamine 5'-phosphate oxidase family protein [Pseudonocardia humida]